MGIKNSWIHGVEKTPAGILEGSHLWLGSYENVFIHIYLPKKSKLC
jgi:hypothetical protein